MFIFVLAAIISARFSYAQSIQTGNSNVNVDVETNIQGNGNVKTHIETNANGVRKVLDANSPGTYRVDLKSDEGNSSSSASPTLSGVPTVVKIENNKQNSPTVLDFINNFRKHIEDFLKKIFLNFAG